MEYPVSRSGLIMMVAILTLVWGGFAASVVYAIVRERRKAAEVHRQQSSAQGRRDG